LCSNISRYYNGEAEAEAEADVEAVAVAKAEAGVSIIGITDEKEALSLYSYTNFQAKLNAC